MTLKDKLQDKGYLIVEDFLSESDINRLRQECHDLVEKMDPDEQCTTFSSEKQNFRDNYFINSADKIGYFFEDGALDEKGQLKVEKHKCLNKIGHALHVFSPAFRQVTFSQKIKDMVRSLGFTNPVIPQSMYIFKQPKIGGKVVCHQDTTYLYTNPMPRLMGLWIALEDCTIENGCLWFIPGSHKEGLYGDYRMIRNPEWEKGLDTGLSCVYVGEKPEYNPDDFVPGPVKKGTLVVIDGLVVHKSEENRSEKSRHIYTFHLYDAGNSTWDSKNWLQPTEAGTFQHLFDVNVD